ncbi:MAG: helix-turn-helix transcriptional regulator [Ruminococcus sp.]|jgi:DNA-binding Xre family transcriptional regulator|nr:helix-turn-helix transcriptional regulator [Ruminococcus sp.]
MIDFSPLWKTLKQKGISTYSLINDYHLSKGTIDSLKHNRNVTLNTIDNLCQILQVPIQEVVTITNNQDSS